MKFAGFNSLYVLFLLAGPLRAEVPDTNAQAPTPEQSLSANPGGGDRKGSSGAAAAMGIAAAAIQGVSCLMMMKAAQEEIEPSKRDQEMAQALQQCAQAAQSAASAAQNSKGAKKNGDDPNASKQKQLQLPKPLLAKNEPKASPGFSLPAEESTSESASPLAAPASEPSSAAEAPFPPPLGDAVADTAREGEAVSAASPKPLPVIDAAKVGYDQAGKIAQEPPPTSANYPPSGARGDSSSAKTSAPGELAEHAPAPPPSSDRSSRERSASHSDADSAGGASGAGETAAGPEALNGLLSELLAGGGSDPSSRQLGTDLLTLPAQAVGAEKGIHIFEYASLRLRRIARKGGWSREGRRAGARTEAETSKYALRLGFQASAKKD